MDKQDYYEAFPQFAKAAVKLLGEEINLTGKCVLVTKIDHIYDIYLCDAKARLEGDFAALLSVRKIGYLLDTLPKGTYIHKLTGEAWFQTHNLEWLNQWLWENRRSLGLHQRKPAPANAFKVLH
jgi:hypothetical protein